VEDATKFLDANNRTLEIEGQLVTLSYSSTKPPANSENKRQDWICPHCNYKNFARRVLTDQEKNLMMPFFARLTNNNQTFYSFVVFIQTLPVKP